MTRREIDLMVEWADKEGWNPGLHDAETFYQTDPSGFFVGVINEEPVGSISTVAYDHTYGFLGFYIVRPEFRGKGYGIQIWNHGMKYLGDRNIGLDGVVAQQDNYKKSGFKLAYRNVRYKGIADGTFSDNVINLSQVPFEKVLVYDNIFFPTSRPQFLKNWIKQPEGSALGVLKGDALSGYGVIRACRKGFKIGPLFADDENIVEILFQSLTSKATGQTVYLDVPAVNKASANLAKRHNMNIVFETARMYTKKEPKLPINKIFGVTTFELG